jgi:hypothetical protein
MEFVRKFDSFINESFTENDRVEFADTSDGLKVPRTGKILEISGRYAIIEYVLDGNKVKTDVLVSRLRKIEESEEKEDLKNYMFFGNLETIKRSVEKIMAMDSKKVDEILSDGHAWAVDHISTSKDDVEEVAGFLENSEEESQIAPELKLAITEYHQALRKQQKLQKKFINTPKENFNERLELKRDLVACMRDTRAKEDQFRYLLKESGEEDFYEN